MRLVPASGWVARPGVATNSSLDRGQSGERSDRRGTFNCLAGLSHITGSGPNQADPKGRPRPVHPDTGDCFGAGAITHFHLSKDERSNAHARRGGRANPTRVLGSRGCWSNAHPAAGCTKSPCVMRISMAPLMLWVDRTGSASGAKGSADSHRPRSSSASRITPPPASSPENAGLQRSARNPRFSEAVACGRAHIHQFGFQSRVPGRRQVWGMSG
jgi:hypothetical protein